MKQIKKHKARAKMYCKAFLDERNRQIEATNKLCIMSKAFMDEQDRRVHFESKCELLEKKNELLNEMLQIHKRPWYKKLLIR